MPEKSFSAGAKAQMDFHCFNEDCKAVIKFNLSDVAARDFQIVCPECHASYELDEALRGKLERMLNLVQAIRGAEDILGDCNVAVATAAGEIRIPYALLLTRLNTIITMQFGNRTVDFHLWIEPSSPDTFR